MRLFRAAKQAYKKVDAAVVRATSPKTWRKSSKPQPNADRDFSGASNVANLRVVKGRESYDLLVDKDEIHVGYQNKQGKTQWRKAADVSDFTAVDLGKPSNAQGMNRIGASTYKTSGGTYKGFDAKVKYLQDLGYQVQALDKRPYKAWRSGDKKTAEGYLKQVWSGNSLQGTPEYFGDYIDPRQSHNAADLQYRSQFFKDVSGQSWQEQKGRVWTGAAWRRPSKPPEDNQGGLFDPPPSDPQGSGPRSPKTPPPQNPKQSKGKKSGSQNTGNQSRTDPFSGFSQTPRITPHKGSVPPPHEQNQLTLNLQIKQLEAPVKTSSSREWRYAQNKPIVPPKPDVYTETKAEKKPLGQLEDQVLISRIIEQVNRDYGKHNPGAGPERSSENVRSTDKAYVPDFDALDELNPLLEKQTSRNIQARAWAQSGASQAASGQPGKPGVQDITRFTSTPVSGEKKGTTEGDSRIEGNEKLSAIFEAEADKTDDPQLKQALFAISQKRKDQAASLVRQKELKSTGKTTEAEKIAQASLETSDPTGLKDALQVYNPATGKTERQQFLTKMPTNATPEVIEAWNQQSGQFAKNLKDVKGFRETDIPTSLPEISARPGQELNEYMKHVPASADSVPARDPNEYNPSGDLTKHQKQKKEAFQRRSGKFPKVRLNPEDQLGKFEITDEKKIERILAQYGDMPQKADAVRRLNDLLSGKSPNADVEQYADAIAPLLGRYRAMNESRYLTSSGINPAEPGTLEQVETTDDRGRSVTKYAAGAPYTDKTAETRLFNAENYILDAGKKSENEWRDYLTKNAPDELKNLNPNLTKAQRRAAIEAIAEKTLSDVFTRQQKNYFNQQEIRKIQESGKQVPDKLLQSIENLNMPGLFDTTMGREYGKKLKLERGGQDIDLSYDIANLAQAAGMIDEKTGQSPGYLGTFRNLTNNDPALNAIVERYAAYDRDRTQKEASFTGRLLEQNPESSEYQSIASNSFNQLARQGDELPSNVVPWERPQEMTPDRALEAAKIAQIEAATQAALPPPTETAGDVYEVPAESGPVPIKTGLSRRAKPAPAPPVEQPPAETPFSLKTPEQPGIGAGRTTGSMFASDTELDKAARAGQYKPLKGQSGLLDQPVETPESRPEIVTDPNVKEISIPLYNPGTSGLKNVPKGGVLEWLANRQIKAPSARKFKGGEYDGAEFFPPSTLAKIYSKDNPKAFSPDLAVQSMIAEGVLPEGSTVNDMWETARKEHLEMPRLAEKASQADKFAAQVLNSGVKKGKTEVDLGHLDIGETIELGGKGHEEEFTFKGILAPGLEDEINLPRSVINELINEGKEGYVLEDGAKYGLQVVPVENGILKANARQEHYVSANKQPGDTVLYDGEEWTVEGHDFNNAETVLIKNAKAKNPKRKRVPLRGSSADELAEQYNRQDGGAGDEWTPF